jgi:hypothetical protein
MTRFAAVLTLFTLAVAAPAQEEDRIRTLLQRLDDDSIEVRAASAADLSKFGKTAVPLLKRASANAGPEMRDRLSEIIRRIQDRERLAALLPPPSRISLTAKDRPLREVFESVLRQSRTGIDLSNVPEDARVTVSLREVPYWTALEEICRASGRVMISPDGDHLAVTAEPYAAIPRMATTLFRVTLERIDLTCNGTLGQPDRFDHFSALFDVAWEKGAQPWRVSARVVEILDEKGDDISGNDSEMVVTSIAPDAIHQELLLDDPHGPGPQATKLARMKVEVSLDFPLRFAELRIPITDGKVPSSVEIPEFMVHVDRLDRQDGLLVAGLTLTPGATPPDGDLVSEGIILRDVKGNSHTGQIRADPQAPSEGSKIEITFADAPPLAQLTELIVRIPAEVHREKLDVDLKDLPLR